MNHRLFLRGVFACAAGLVLSAAAHAQEFRTYLSPAGFDTNPCTLPAPCRLLPAALATVIDGGEIWMLGSANYNVGPVAITKSVTILAVPGALGSVVATAGNAINIATPGVKVALRNLVIVPFVGGPGGGVHGIFMTAGTSLTVENCLIANLPGDGINVNTAASVRVTDTTIRNNSGPGMYIQNGARATVTRAIVSGNNGGGITVQGTTSSTTTADIADSTMSGNNNGVSAHSANAAAVVKVSLFDSRVVGNTSFGVIANSNAGGPAIISVSNNVISNNVTGFWVIGPGSRVSASGNTITNHTLGFDNAGGAIEAGGDNAVRNNTTQSTGGAISTFTKL